MHLAKSTASKGEPHPTAGGINPCGHSAPSRLHKPPAPLSSTGVRSTRDITQYRRQTGTWSLSTAWAVSAGVATCEGSACDEAYSTQQGRHTCTPAQPYYELVGLRAPHPCSHQHRAMRSILQEVIARAGGATSFSEFRLALYDPRSC